MARRRDPARKLAREIWIKSSGKVKLKDIADQLNKPPSTIRKWKSEDDWDKSQSKRNAPFQKERSFSSSAPKAVAESDLPDKQKLFAMLYLQRFNATWAYMKAYGASYETSAVEGSRHLRKPKIAAMINQLKKEQAADLHMTQMDLLKELAKQVKADLGDYIEFGSKDEPIFNDKGDPLLDPKTGKQATRRVSQVSLRQKRDVDTSLLKSLHIGRDGVVVELYDKQKAIEMLLKNLPDVAIRRKTEAEARVAEINLKALTGEGYKNPLLDAIAESAKELLPKEGDQDEDEHQGD